MSFLDQFQDKEWMTPEELSQAKEERSFGSIRQGNWAKTLASAPATYMEMADPTQKWADLLTFALGEGVGRIPAMAEKAAARVLGSTARFSQRQAPYVSMFKAERRSKRNILDEGSEALKGILKQRRFGFKTFLYTEDPATGRLAFGKAKGIAMELGALERAAFSGDEKAIESLAKVMNYRQTYRNRALAEADDVAKIWGEKTPWEIQRRALFTKPEFIDAAGTFNPMTWEVGVSTQWHQEVTDVLYHEMLGHGTSTRFREAMGKSSVLGKLRDGWGKIHAAGKSLDTQAKMMQEGAKRGSYIDEIATKHIKTLRGELYKANPEEVFASSVEEWMRWGGDYKDAVEFGIIQVRLKWKDSLETMFRIKQELGLSGELPVPKIH